MDSPNTPRARARRETEQRILELGTQHLATHGAAALSLRAIARELGLVSSAVYRYVASRDELLTRLVVAAYTDLADHAEAAAATRVSPRTRVLAIAEGMRDWAVREPARWALLYGSPVPGYHAPAETTTDAGTRLTARLLRELADAQDAGMLEVPRRRLSGALRGDLVRIAAEAAPALRPTTLLAGFGLWTTVVGAISAEVFEQYGGQTFSVPGELFTQLVTAATDELFGR